MSKEISMSEQQTATPNTEGTRMSVVKAIPEGHHTLTPHLVIKGAASAIEFYKTAFGATELFRMADGGKVGHAELKIGDSHLMLADEYPEMGYKGPKSLGGAAVSLLLYVENVDAVVEQAVAAGATLVRPTQDQFYGDRSGTVHDPFGHIWTIATHKEDVSVEEMKRRQTAMSHSQG
jgi:PhnB protein